MVNSQQVVKYLTCPKLPFGVEAVANETSMKTGTFTGGYFDSVRKSKFGVPA
jgi:hypothetical protein